ncbi:MAG: glycerate kinase [Clostridiales bacterium]|nr:glycerate kinase [Clostridiales bacterium]
MKVVIATDSFKGTLTSYEAGVAIKEGILRANPEAEVIVRGIADGGEGTFDVITKACGGSFAEVKVPGPLFKEVTARYGIIEDPSSRRTTAVIDISQACGLTLVPPKLRDPLYTTSAGVGRIILDALDRGCRRFIIGLGGSATNDCGTGMLQALGIRLKDSEGGEIDVGALGLAELSRIDETRFDERIGESEFLIACDVNNPLTGENGCSMVYAPQKGASEEACRRMDGWIEAFARLVKLKHPDADPSLPGAGAAGGLGFTFRTFFDGEMVSGAKLVAQQTRLVDYVIDADIIITGEGRLDGQTLMGKAPHAVARLGAFAGAKVIAFAGCLGADAAELYKHGFDEIYSISERVGIEESMREAASLLTQKAYEVFDGRTI